jgi:hypothetical protein
MLPRPRPDCSASPDHRARASGARARTRKPPFGPVCTDADSRTPRGRDRPRIRQPGRGGPGGGSAARPSAASRRRMACGSVTAPRVRRGPPKRSQTKTGMANTRRRRQAQGHRPGWLRPWRHGRGFGTMAIASARGGRGRRGRRAMAGVAAARGRQALQQPQRVQEQLGGAVAPRRLTPSSRIGWASLPLGCQCDGHSGALQGSRGLSTGPQVEELVTPFRTASGAVLYTPTPRQFDLAMLGR